MGTPYDSFINFFENAFVVIRKIAIAIVKVPVKILNALPDWFRLTLAIVLVVLCLLLVWWLWRNRDSWKAVYH